MNSTVEPTVYYFHNMMSLLVDCISTDPSSHIRCITTKLVGITSGCVLPLIICLGLLGNGIVAHVMLIRVRPLTRQNAYFGGIAVVDSITMTVFGVVNLFLSRGLPWLSGGRVGYIMQNDGDLGCKMYYFVISVCPLMSAAMLLVMVADRTLSTLMPFRFRALGPSVALKAMLGAAVASVLLSILPTVTATRVAHNFKGQYSVISIACYFTTDYASPVMFYWNLVCYPPTLVLLAVVLLNLVLLACVVRAVRERQQNLTASGGAAAAGTGQQQPLSGVLLIQILSAINLAAQLPVVAVLWTLQMFGYSDAKDTVANKVLVDILGILSSFMFVGQASSFLVMFRGNARFRSCVLEMTRLRAGRYADGAQEMRVR